MIKPKAEISQQSNKSIDTSKKATASEKIAGEQNTSSTGNKKENSTKYTKESKNVANKPKEAVIRSKIPCEKTTKSPANSSTSISSPKGQQKKGNAKEKSTAAKSEDNKKKTSPNATVTKEKSNKKVNLNDITKKVKEATIADTAH